VPFEIGGRKMELKLLGKYIIKARIVAKTGLHIGGSNSSLKIGGVDTAVIKDSEGKPYIPGSSLKGKMRSLLEFSEGRLKPESMIEQKGIKIHMCDDEKCPICIIFGRNHGKHDLVDGGKVEFENITPTRIIVRDAYLIPDSITNEMKKNMEFEWTEVKFENTLDRITSAANPRQLERVPRGAKFEVEIIYNILNDYDKQLFSKVLAIMKLLEDDTLGGSGSRGYGKVAFEDIKIYWNSVEDYEKGNITEHKDPLYEGSSLAIVASKFLE